MGSAGTTRSSSNFVRETGGEDEPIRVIEGQAREMHALVRKDVGGCTWTL